MSSAEFPLALAQLEHLAASPLPKLLMLTHAMGGGVARHLTELATQLAGEALVLQLSPCLGARQSVQLELPGVANMDGLRLVFAWPEQQPLLWQLLAFLGVGQLHVHHVIGWPAGFWDDFIRRGLAFDLTLHDHCIFSAVQRGPMQNVPLVQWLDRVQRCFSNSVREAQILRQLLAKARRVFVPSHALQDALLACMPEAAQARLEVRAHPEAEQWMAWQQPYLRALASDEPLRVLCLGMLSVEKGAQELARVAKEAVRTGSPLEFHLLGSCHEHLPAEIVRHGRYQDAQVPELLERIRPHVLWLPAQCPETWSYTLSAGLRAGLPIVATRLGVFPERLQQRPLSWLCDAQFSVSRWLGVLLQVRENHLQRPAQVSNWRYQAAPAFYNARSGYVLQGAATGLPKSDKLPDALQLGQALVKGLPQADRWQERLLRGLLRLKYSRLLAPVARWIPYGWQRRLKRMISRAPLHEPAGKQD